MQQPIPRQLAARLAHEVRSPLNVLRGALDQAQRDEGMSTTSAQLLKLARRSCVRLERLSRRLDVLATGEPTDRGPVSLDAIGDWVERARTEASRSSIDLQADISAQLPTVPGPVASALEVAVDEAVHNAVRHAASKVTVRVECDGPSVRVLVEDDGPGFPDELVGTAPVPNSEHRGGLGLGLFVAHAFLAAAEGTLSITRERVVLEVPTT